MCQTLVARDGSDPAGLKGCRRRGSSFSSAAFLGPTGGQRGGDERQEQLVMPGDCVAARFRSAAAAGRGGGTLHYILHRTVVLDKVEIRCSNGAQRDSEISHDGNGFEKYLRQKNGGAPIEVHAAGMHLLHQRAEQAEIVMRGIAKRRAVRGWMHVRNIRADSEMDRYGNAMFVGCNEDAEIGVFDVDDPAR